MEGLIQRDHNVDDPLDRIAALEGKARDLERVLASVDADLLDGYEASEFVLRDGSVALTANWDAGSYKITAEQLESDVATGTAPLIVASTTKVTNLNADQVDGLDDTDILQADGSVALTGDWDMGSFQMKSAKFWADEGEVKIEITAGDPKVLFNIAGGDKWCIGVDDSDDDDLKIDVGGTVGGATALIIDSSTSLVTLTVSGSGGGIRPDTDEEGQCGTPTRGWWDVNSKDFTDIGCLGCFDDGVELLDGSIVSDVEAIRQVRVRKDGALTPYGLPRLDYATMPKAVAKEAWKEDEEGNREFYRYNASLTALISIMMGAIKELDARVREVEV